MSKDFQNGVALGLAMGGVVEVEIPAKEEQEKTITITENGTTEILPDENKALSKVTVVTDVSGGSDISVEYIESTGTQYIDTGYVPTANTKIVADFSFTKIETGGSNIPYYSPYGCVDSSNNGIKCVQCGSLLATRFGSVPANGNDDTLVKVNNRYCIEHSINGLYLNGVLAHQYSGTTLASDLSQTLYIFALNNNGSVDQCSFIKLYSFKIYEGEELVRDFVPAIDENGVVCLYDNVTKTYFYNQGSGEFAGKFVEKAKTASLNIAYGETAPEDTSKLWIKANEPKNITVSSDSGGVESISLCDDYLPIACYAMGCARVGKKIYLFGGYDTVAQDVVHVFDTETETITTLGSILPERLNSMGCANVGTKIYVFGGISSSAKNTIYEFDTETKDIKTLSVKLPQNLSGMSCARVGNKIYLFGGHNGDKYVNTIVVFNTETKSITTSSVTLPDTTRAMGCAVVGTKIYLFGGRDDVITDTIKVFDTESETITTLETTLPEKNIYNIICATIGTKIYLFGGYLSGVGSKDTIAVFDTETEEIITLDTKMFTGAYGFGCASMGKDIYLFGGLDSSRLNTISRFTLTHELSQGNIEIEKDFFNNKFNLINTDTAQVEIGVENVFIGNENNEAELVEAYLHNGTEWQQI